MADADVDRNLLFAVIALQDDLIDQKQLAEVCAVWALRMGEPLADLLAERGWVGVDDRREIERKIERKLLKHHGDARASLGAVAGADARDVLRLVNVPRIRDSLLPLPAPAGYVRVETLVQTTEQQRSRYTLTRLHAEGGLGKVWLARDADLNREVALKEIKGDQAAHPEVRRRFLKEAQITGQLEHPNIVPVYELSYRPEDGQPFYTMRLVKGRTLREAIAEHHRRHAEGRGDPLSFPLLLQAFVAVCQAVAYAHSRAIIHRDLKPDNVVLGGFGEVVLLDWGLAKRVDRPDLDELPSVALTGEAQTDATVANAALGTPAYMAPEQAEGRVDLIDTRTDVYGLGAILFEVLTDHPPRNGTNVADLLRKIIHDDTPRARTLAPTAPRSLDAVCARAMARKRGDRYGTVSELVADVQRWLADEPVSAWREPALVRAVRWARRHKPAVAGLAAALAVAALSAFAALSWNHQRLASLRAEAQDFVLRGRAAFASEDDANARLYLASALAKVGAEPSLADLKEQATRFLRRADSRSAGREAVRSARATYERFLGLRDDAWFHATLLTGLDPADDLKATVAACRDALRLFGVDADSGASAVLEAPHLDARARAEVATGCYELLLLLADAESAGPPDQPPDASRALRALEAAARLGPPTRSFHLRRATCLAATGDGRGAATERERAAALEPAGAVDEFLLGDHFYKEGDLERAVSHFDAALRWQPEHFWAQYFLAVSDLRLQRPAEAKACLTACLSRRPGFLWSYVYRGFAHGELNAFPAAEDDFLKRVGLGPDEDARYTIHVNRGATRVRQGWPEGAVDDLTKAVALKPQQYQAHVDLAHAYEKWERWHDAEAEFGAAVRLAPGLSSVRRSRARYYLGRHDTAAALRDFEESIRLEPAGSVSPSLASDHTERARILLGLPGGRYRERWACAAALAIDPGSVDAQALRAESLLKLGRYAEAASSLDVYLREGKPTLDVLKVRAAVRAKLGDYAGAVEDDTRALATGAGPETFRHRGWAYVYCEAWKLALRDFEAALALDPDDGEAYNGRGYARARSGQSLQGAGDAEEALRRGPEDAEMTFNVACTFALAARDAESDAARPGRQAATQRFRDRALAALGRSLEQLPREQRPPFWRDRVLTDPDLNFIRQSPEFAQLGATTNAP